MVFIHNGLSCGRFDILRVGRLPRHWFMSFCRFPFSVHFVNAKRSHGPLCDKIARSRFFRSPNTLETPRNEAVYLIISSTDILKTNINVLSMRWVDKIPRRMTGIRSNSARDITMNRTFRMVCLWHDSKVDLYPIPVKEVTNFFLE